MLATILPFSTGTGNFLVSEKTHKKQSSAQRSLNDPFPKTPVCQLLTKDPAILETLWDSDLLRCSVFTTPPPPPDFQKFRKGVGGQRYGAKFYTRPPPTPEWGVYKRGGRIKFPAAWGLKIYTPTPLPLKMPYGKKRGWGGGVYNFALEEGVGAKKPFKGQRFRPLFCTLFPMPP